MSIFLTEQHSILVKELLEFLFSFFFRIKNNGGNFLVKLSRKETRGPDVSVPEELVQIQAYLRWERKGKQNYTPEKEKASNKYL